MSYVIAAPEMMTAAATDLAEYRFDAQRGQRGRGDPDDGGAGRG